MKDYKRLQEECMQEVVDAGIKPGKISRWSINSRAKSRWGLCRKRNDAFEIEISSNLLTDDRIDEKACKTTMIHEILHTCKDSMKHTGNWKINAEIMNAKYGYDIKRVTKGEEKGIENYNSSSMDIRYSFRCRYCGQIIVKRKKCKFTRYYKNYGCGICGNPRAFDCIKRA